MLKKTLFTSLLNLCKEYNAEYRTYKRWDVVIDHISDHNIYIFASGWFTVSSMSALGGIHEVGEINPPSMIGEGVFFGSFKKPVKVVCDTDYWEVYVLSERMIWLISKHNNFFHEMLMRACLAVTNERINEANTERTIGYTLVDALENHTFHTIPALLTTLKNTFSLIDVLWIERHEILPDIFSIRYQESFGNVPVNMRISFPDHGMERPFIENGIVPTGVSYVYPFLSRGECFGYLVYVTEKHHMPGYVTRITLDMVPNCIRIIESGWKEK